ncbi:MAG: hypothetical protein VW405_01285 [Rhodospirillaceae bacterium]
MKVVRNLSGKPANGSRVFPTSALERTDLGNTRDRRAVALLGQARESKEIPLLGNQVGEGEKASPGGAGGDMIEPELGGMVVAPLEFSVRQQRNTAVGRLAGCSSPGFSG